MAQVLIETMNSFLITVDGRAYEGLAAKSRKGVSLMQYLMMERGKEVSSQRLIREMWSGSNHFNPEGSLKTMISRVRAMLNQLAPGLGACIVSGAGTYRWQNLNWVRVDVLELLKTFDKLKECDDDTERTLLTERVLRLYKGDMFQTGDLNNGIALVNWLHHEYLDAVYAYIEQLKREEAYNKICNVCRAALQVDDLDEQLHIELMHAMVNLNRAQEAMAEYHKLVKQTRRALDAEPSEELTAAYENLAQAGQTLRFNLDVIRNELNQQDSDRRGPFFCEYRAFKEIYNIQMRNLERLGSTMFLGVVMLGEPGDGMSSVRLEGGMASLHVILEHNLRKGDIVTRFSENIYAMLLPTVNYKTGSMVIERIQQLFYQEYPNSTIAFHGRISPLGNALS